MTVDIDILTRDFPAQAIKYREGGGGKRMAYLETQTVVRRLNEATENSWDFRVTRFEWHGDLLIATGEMTLPGLGTRAGTGVQRVHEKSEDLVKGAASDCLKNCARLFGVGLSLYGPDYESGEIAAPQASPQRTESPRPNEPARVASDDPNAATDAQKRKLLAMGRALKGWDAEQVKGDIRARYMQDGRTFTKQDASDLITEWQTEVDNAESARQ